VPVISQPVPQKQGTAAVGPELRGMLLQLIADEVALFRHVVPSDWEQMAV
jgi:hypothetical protein